MSGRRRPLRLDDGQRIDIAVTYAFAIARREHSITRKQSMPLGHLFTSEEERKNWIDRDKEAIERYLVIVRAIALSREMADSVLASARKRIGEEPE